MNPKVSIIILNYKGWEDTIECLKSISNFEYPNFNVLLIDNGSPNDSYSKINKWLSSESSTFQDYETIDIGNNKNIVSSHSFVSKKLIFLKSSFNHGFAIGNNIGISFSEKMGSDYAYLLNNDTVSQPDSLTKLITYLHENENVLAVTPQIRLFDPNDRIWNCGGELYHFGTRKYDYANQHINKVPQKGVKEISLITGCALLFKYKETGLLTEKYFFGEEDFEMSLRLKSVKKKMACIYDSVIWHKVGGSIKKDKKWPIGKVYVFYLSRFMNLKDYTFFPIWILNVSIQSLYGFTMLLFRNKIGLYKSVNLFLHVFKGLRKYDKVDYQLFYDAVYNEKFN